MASAYCGEAGVGRRSAVWRWAVAWLVLGVVLGGGACRPVPTPDADEGVAVPGRAVSFDGVPVVFERTGSGTPAVVLIHGWSCNRSYWQQQTAALAERFTVVSLDLPGHGESGSDREIWSMESYGRDVAAVVQELKLDNVILVGHSMGGPISLVAARLLPEQVLGVAAVDSLHNVEMVFDQEEWTEAMDHFERDFRGTCEMFVRGMYRSDADPALVDWTVGDMCGADAEVARALLLSFSEFQASEALAAAGVPVRVINSDMYATELEINRRHAGDFDAVIMEGVGHFPHLERPEEFTEILLEVLDRLAAPPAS